MTEVDNAVRPIPDATRFQRRIEQPSPGRSIWTTIPTWAALSADELDALPVGTRRTVAFVPGVYVSIVRNERGWTLLSRHCISSDALAGLRTAPRVPIDPEETPDHGRP